MTLPAVSQDSSPALVELAQAGDASAFAALVGHHQHEVFTLAMRLVGGDHALADDVAQEAFIRAWKALPRFRGESALATWLHRITVNTALTHRTKRSKKATTALDAVPEIVDLRREVDPALAAENLGLRRVLRDALALLHEDQRRVVILKDLEGWPHQEIADALGITVSAAKVRLHRGRKRLRDRLEEVGF